MENIVKPVACRIMDVKRESLHEYTFKVETDIKPQHGQFLQLSIPKVGEAPISVSSFGDGWMDFTIRSVGKVTDEIFNKQPGDTLFLRGAYGKGWPVEQFAGKLEQACFTTLNQGTMTKDLVGLVDEGVQAHAVTSAAFLAAVRGNLEASL